MNRDDGYVDPAIVELRSISYAPRTHTAVGDLCAREVRDCATGTYWLRVGPGELAHVISVIHQSTTFLCLERKISWIETGRVHPVS